jgi:hypothetical protein
MTETADSNNIFYKKRKFVSVLNESLRHEDI